MRKVWFYDSPIGKLGIAEDGIGICEIFFAQEERVKEAWITEESMLIREAWSQLLEYFEGKRKEFDLPLSLKGTDFQLADWAALRTIPYGETCSYGDIARKIGNPKACRAVGMANHRNPVSIVIPCHRVIGQNGKLTGYGGGLYRKEYLLELERKFSQDR